MQTPPNLNEHHLWGGERLKPSLDDSRSDDGGLEQTTLFAPGQQAPGIQPLSQAGFVASSSDDLFHPTSGGPFPYTFPLSNIPLTPSTRHQVHYPTSSYNNPSFQIPPSHLLPTYTNLNRLPVGPPPPIPPRPRMLPQIPVDQIPLQNTAYTQPFSNISPPIRQINSYNHRSSPSPPLSSSSARSLSPKTLPTVTHVPILTSKHDFFAWDEAVNSLIYANGLIGHILDPSVAVNPYRPDLAPTPIPTLSVPPSASEITALSRWWAKDSIAQHILVSRLGSVPRGLLPSPNIVTRTALAIYKLLLQYYGTCNFADCTDLLGSLHGLICTPGRVQEFVSKWRTGISRLQSAKVIFNIKICMSFFVRGLPSIPAFNSIRAELPFRIAAILHDQDFGAFISMTERVLELDTIFRSASQNPRQPRVPTIPNPTILPSPAAPESSPRALNSKPVQTCNNCKSRGLRNVGHTDGTCFQPGGGMEGRRDEYLKNKGHIHAMFVEYLENALTLEDSVTQITTYSPSTSPDISPTLDDEVLIPPIANLCISTSAPNSDFVFDLYLRRDPSTSNHSTLAFPVVDFRNSALASIVASFNALLDSGCTHHIIRDRGLFRNYTTKTISVGTANCGSLEALGTGDVDFRYPYGNHHVIFTLRGCLHAPTAPIDLLSVGALVERGMFCLFSPGGITKVFFPKDHPVIPSFVFTATVSNRLSFLKLDFVRPPIPDAPSPTAFPARADPSADPSNLSFSRVKLDSMLWHRRFGHIGMEATRAALTKNYVTGIHFEGPFLRDHCIACIVGKSPQQSYSHNGHRAAAVGELLHMDLCGPYPVQAPHGERYFYNILDDKSNFGFTFGLRQKSDAFSNYLVTEAFLERSNGVRVLAIRCGGELELSAGKMREHLASKGIIIQRTVPYAHEQNGKSERYIRTLEEGGQALLAGSGLPMSFWLDAVLTRQYLCNRLPTSTLPSDVTPFESITNGRKPDLSHLRVWGCDCFVAVPSELRPKAGFKRFRAIFVGYEEHRIGWRVRDLNGKYSFSNNVIFNGNLSGRLGIPCSSFPY